MKICWHSDDLKVPHKNTKAVTILIDYFKGIYGNITIHHVKLHDYMGIIFYFSTPG